MLNELIYLTPEIILLLTGLALLFMKKYKEIPFILLTGALAAALVINLFFFNVNEDIIFGSLALTDLTIILRLLVLSGTMIFLIGSKEFAFSFEDTYLYLAFLSFASIGMLVLPMANDLITLFIAFELTSISTYALPFIDQRTERRFEAGVKYFLAGAFSSGLILFGMSYLFGLTGSVYFADISQNLATYNGPLDMAAYFSLAMILGGFSYKMALAPFHLWAPDTYYGAPSPVSGYLAGITKKGPFIAAFKVFLLAFVALKLEVTLLLGFLSILTMTVGNMAALMQTDVKKMMAYSSVANAGTILAGFAVANTYALTGSVIHMWAHLLMTTGAFTVIYYVGERKGKTTFAAFSGLNKEAPLIAICMTVFLMSLGGIPPLLGFWSKISIIFGSVEAGGYYFILALAIILNSALSLAYYFKVIKHMYMLEAEESESKESKSFVFAKISILASSFILIATGLLPGKVISLVMNALEMLIG